MCEAAKHLANGHIYNIFFRKNSHIITIFIGLLKINTIVNLSYGHLLEYSTNVVNLFMESTWTLSTPM